MGTRRQRSVIVLVIAALIFEAGAGAPASVLSAERPPDAAAETPLAVEAEESEPSAPEPIELAELRTETSRTIDNGDGTHTAEIFAEPIHYRPSSDAAWQPIALGFEPADGTFAAASERAPTSVSLRAADAPGGYLAIDDGHHPVSFSFLGALGPELALSRTVAAVAPELDGSRALYRAVLPGVGLQVHAAPDGAKTFLVLDSAEAGSTFAFGLIAPGLVPKAADDGGLALVDAAGVEVGHIPRPYAVDSSADEGRAGGAFSDAVRLEATEIAGAPVVLVHIDEAWLAKATFPVYVDPSYYPSTDAYGDAFVSQAYPTQNFADYVRPDSPYYHEHWLGMDPTNSTNVNYVYLRFDISSIGAATITNATLNVVPYHQYYNAPTATTTWVDRVTGSWTESGLTWNNKPASTNVGSAGLVEGEWGSFNVTTTVQAWSTGTYPNYGFKLHENGNNGTYWKRLISYEQGSNRPYLSVTYHVPVATATTIHNWTASRSVAWTYADSAGHAQSHYQVQASTSASFGTLAYDSGAVASAATSHTIPAPSLTAGTQYWWRVRVKDGTSWSAYDGDSILYDPTAPTGTIAINGGAAQTNTSSVRLVLTAPDSGTTSSYTNDGRALTSITPGCASTTCGSSWASHTLGLSKAEGAVVARASSDAWASLTVDPTAGNRAVLAFDVMRDAAVPTYVGLVSDVDDGYRFELRTGAAPYTSLTTLGYTTTSTPRSYTNEAINLPFSPGIWYRFIVSASGSGPGTYNLWWYERDAVQAATPPKIVTGVYLPSPRLHLFHRTDGILPAAHVYLDDLKVDQNDASAPFGSGTTGVRFSTDGTTWGPWTGYAASLEYSLPSGAGTRTVYAQFRDAAGNTSGTFSDAITVAFDNLGRQDQHQLEAWDLGAGDELAVNAVTGNLVLTHPIVSLPYRGGNVLPLTLTYNAHAADDVGFGAGWQLDVQRRLLLEPDGTVIFIDADGARHRYTAPVSAGTQTTYTRPPGLYATLIRDSSWANEFRLTYRDQGRDEFDPPSGSSIAALVRSVDRHGNDLDFAYSAGNLTTITDPADRVVSLTWDTAPTPDRLTAIADWAWINAAGEVQADASGSRRTHRFFYDAAGGLSGWADPLDTAGACPSAASHRTCLTYTAGLLAGVSKTQTYTTLSAGALGTATRTLSTALSYAGSRVATVTDAEARQTRFVPDGSDRLIIRRPLSTTTLNFQATADAYGRVAYVWRQFDELTEIERRTSWDTGFPTEPASVTDNYGALQATPARTTSYTYQAGSLGLLSRVVEPLNASESRWTDYVYNANNDLTGTVVSLAGSATQRTETRSCYDAGCTLTGSGLTLLAQVDNYVAGGPSNHDTNVRTDYAYDAYGQRTSVTRHNRDAAGAVLDDREDRFVYDAAGNLVAEIVNHADGQVTGGDDLTPSATTQARTDLTTAHAYDSAGNRISSADPRRAILAATGTPAADDFVTRATYDALNQRLTETTPTTPGVQITQRQITTRYDELGAVRSATDFGGLTSATLFDRSGAATATYEQPAGEGARQTSSTTLDGEGRPATSRDERQLGDGSLGHTAWVYDRLGREVAVASAVGTPAATENDSGYDALDRRVTLEIGVASPASLLTTYAHDLGGRVLDSDDAFTCTRQTFDYQDRPLSTTSGLQGNGCAAGSDQRTVAHSYDGLGRPIREEVTAGAGTGDRTLDDAFDAVGNRLLAATRKAGVTQTTSFVVNRLNQVTAEDRFDGSLAKTTYDAAGNATDRCFWRSGPGDACQPVGSSWSVDAPDQVTSTGYDARNQRISLRNGATNGETVYDPDHNYQVKAIYTPTASGRELQTLFAYDPRHRLAGEGSEAPALLVQVCSATAAHQCTDTPAVVASDVYAYDDNDNRTRVAEFNGAASSDRRYCYDAVDRLAFRNTGAACSSAANDESYVYDDAGNRTSMTLGGVTTAFTYDAAGRLTAAGGAPVTYDSAGRTKTYAGWFFEYDPEGRLVRACKAGSCAGSGFDRLDFAYDGEGHRTQIVATAAAGGVTTTDFRYQGDAVVEEKVNGVVARSFVVDEAGAIVKMTIPSGPNAGDYLVSWNGHGDALHLLRIRADGTTELANTFSYSTWGTPSVDGSHDNSATGADYGDLGFRYLYVGEFDVQWDNAFGLGLHYMHARHYAPALGRFLQPDPDGMEDSLYAYAANNPVTEIDPDGTCFIVCIVVGAVVDTALYLATTDSSQWDFGAAVSTVAQGAVESAVNPFAKISRAARLVSAASRLAGKASRVTASVGRAARQATSAPRLAFAAPRAPQWGPRWTPPTRGPKVTPPPRLRPVANPGHRNVMDSMLGPFRGLVGGGIRAPRPCAGHGLRCVGYGIGIALLASAVTARYLAPRPD